MADVSHAPERRRRREHRRRRLLRLRRRPPRLEPLEYALFSVIALGVAVTIAMAIANP